MEERSNDSLKIYAKDMVKDLKESIYDNILRNIAPGEKSQGNTFPDQNQLDKDILEVFNIKKATDQEKANKLYKVCLKNLQCIIYAGIQYTQEDTPSAGLLYKALTIQSRVIII